MSNTLIRQESSNERMADNTDTVKVDTVMEVKETNEEVVEANPAIVVDMAGKGKLSLAETGADVFI